MLIGLPQTGQTGTSSLGTRRSLEVVVGPVVARHGALPEAVVALRVEEPVLGESRLLELVVHIGGDDEEVLVADDRQQLGVSVLRRVRVTVAPDVAAPESPGLLRGAVGVEARGIHVRETVGIDEIAEEPFEALSRVGESGAGRKTRTGADDDGIGIFDRLGEPAQKLLPACTLAEQHLAPPSPEPERELPTLRASTSVAVSATVRAGCVGVPKAMVPEGDAHLARNPLHGSGALRLRFALLPCS